MNNRIKKLRKYLKLSQEDFGSGMGYGQAAVGYWENGQRAISDSVVLLIASTYHVNEEWLRTGEGEMFSSSLKTVIDELTSVYHLSEFDRRLVEAFASLPKEQRQVVQNLLTKAVLGELPGDVTDHVSNRVFELTDLHNKKIPILGNVAGGIPIDIVEGRTLGYVEIDPNIPVDFALYIVGDSMEPKISSNDLVLIHKQDAIDAGQIGVFYINGENTCKKYVINPEGLAELHSFNPKYEPICFASEDDARVIGQVIGIQHSKDIELL